MARHPPSDLLRTPMRVTDTSTGVATDMQCEMCSRLIYTDEAFESAFRDEYGDARYQHQVCPVPVRAVRSIIEAGAVVELMCRVCVEPLFVDESVRHDMRPVIDGGGGVRAEAVPVEHVRCSAHRPPPGPSGPSMPVLTRWEDPPCSVCHTPITKDQAYLSWNDGTGLRHVPGECVHVPATHPATAVIGILPEGFRPPAGVRTLLDVNDEFYVDVDPDGTITIQGPAVAAAGLDGRTIEGYVEHVSGATIHWGDVRRKLAASALITDGTLEDRNGKGWWDVVSTPVGDIETAGDLLAWLLGLDDDPEKDLPV